MMRSMRTPADPALAVVGPEPEEVSSLALPEPDGADARVLSVPVSTTAPVPASVGAEETPGKLVEGRVLDSDGNPISGASVFARGAAISGAESSRVVSDRGGRFRLSGLPSAFDLWAETDHLVASEALKVQDDSPDAVRDAEIVLVAPRTIRGRVLDEYGEPVDGARVKVLKGGSSRSARPGPVAGSFYRPYCPEEAVSDPEGQFELGWLSPRPLQLRTASDRHPPVFDNVAVGEERVEVVLSDPHRLDVLVTDLAGRAVSGARVRLDGGTKNLVRAAETDVAGACTFDFLPSDAPFLLAVDAAGHAPLVLGSLVSPEDDAPLRLVLGPPSSLEGRVFGPDGMPLAGAAIRVTPDVLDEAASAYRPFRLAASRLVTVGETSTDDAGRFRVDDLCSGALLVEARAPGAPRLSTLRSVPAHERDVEIRLGQTALRPIMHGRILDGVTGLPIEGEVDAVALDPSRPETAIRAKLDAEGYFEISVPHEARWYVLVEAGGYAPRAFDPRSDAEYQEIHLHPTVDCNVRILDRRGDPLASGCVSLADQEGRPLLAWNN